MSNAPEKLIALAAGGTGGHMFPAEALAQEMKRRGWGVMLATDARGARYTDAFPADYLFQISAGTPSIGGPVAKGLAALSIAGGLWQSLREFRKRKPDLAVGFGGYPSLPAMKAAAFLNVPYGVHEQNGVLGRANRMLVKDAAFTAHAFPILEKLPNGVAAIEVGNPVRDAVGEAASEMAPIEPGADINILIFGGSQGASLFSEAPVKVLCGLPDDLKKRVRVTQQAREGELEAVRSAYGAAGLRYEVEPFFKDLPQRIANSHLVISRSGASTITEISIIGRPSILAPLAIAMDDHQTGNARVLSEAGGAILLPEKEFTEKSLADAMTPLLSEPSRLMAMAKAAKGRVKEGAAARLADLVEQHVETRRAAA